MNEGDRARPSIVGRGAAANPKNRFEKIGVEPDPADTGDEPRPETVYLRDREAVRKTARELIDGEG